MVDTDDTRRTTDDGRRTTSRVWYKLPTGELKTKMILKYCCYKIKIKHCKTAKGPNNLTNSIV